MIRRGTEKDRDWLRKSAEAHWYGSGYGVFGNVDEWQIEERVDRLLADGVVLICDDDECEPVGFIGGPLERIPTVEEQYMLRALYWWVHPSRRRRGYAEEMIRAWGSVARSMECVTYATVGLAFAGNVCDTMLRRYGFIPFEINYMGETVNES